MHEEVTREKRFGIAHGRTIHRAFAESEIDAPRAPCSLAVVDPRVHQCPRCGAPLSVPPGAWSVRCTFCQVDVSLLGSAQQHKHEPIPTRPEAPAPPSATAILRHKAILLIGMAVFGVLAVPTFLFMAGHDKTDRAAMIAVVSSVIAFVFYGVGRRLLACVLAIPIGLVLLIKPFVWPVTYDGRPMSINSETHYYFLIPGVLMVVVFGWLLLGAFEKRKKVFEDGILLRVAAGVLFFAGVYVGQSQFGGPTIAEIIERHRPQGAEMRALWKQFAASLPIPGKLLPHEVKLVPPPMWIEDRRSESNIEIISVSELTDPDDSPSHGNLYLSDELLHCVRWTGRKNPMSSSTMSDSAGDFTQRMTRAFDVPYLAAYRGGGAGIEVFVFDVKTGRLAAATSTPGSLSDFSQGRKTVLEALAKATGGTFELK